MRLFLAIELPAEIKRKLHEQLISLNREYRQFAWVDPENYHITLHFFGEVEKPESLIDRIERAIFEIQPFRLYSFDAGMFINKKITLYVGFRREKSLERMVDNLKETFAPDSQVEYVPHLTIARYKLPSKQQYLLLKKKLPSMPVEIEFPVKSITLFQSIVAHKKSIYKKIKSFKLNE
jgi:2'-5' RNA ligase